MPAHLTPPRYLQAKQLHNFRAQLSLGQSCHRQKSLASICTGSLQSCPTLCDPVDCSLPGFSVREGVLQARILEHIGQYWLSYPSRALYFLLPWLPTPLSTWCFQNPVTQAAAPSSHLALTGANQSPPRQPQEQTPVDEPHAELEIKPQLKPRGSVAKEDPKLSHQLYRLQIKSTQSSRQTVSVEYIKRHRELPQQKIHWF